MNKYIVFKCAHYYPFGGAEDILKITDTLEEAKQEILEEVDADGLVHNDYHILDVVNDKLIHYFDDGFGSVNEIEFRDTEYGREDDED